MEPMLEFVPDSITTPRLIVRSARASDAQAVNDGNERSWRVAERAGFRLEGVLRCQSLTPTGEPRDTRVYAKTHARAGPLPSGLNTRPAGGVGTPAPGAPCPQL